MKKFSKLQELFNSNTPFAVCQYFVSLKKVRDESVKKYMLLYVNEYRKIETMMLSKESINFVQNNLDRIPKVLDNKHGIVYEFNSFKEHKEILGVSHEQLIR
jgi:hypothetical protein